MIEHRKMIRLMESWKLEVEGREEKIQEKSTKRTGDEEENGMAYGGEMMA